MDTLKTPYYDSQGNIMGIIGISRDITEKYKKEELHGGTLSVKSTEGYGTEFIIYSMQIS